MEWDINGAEESIREAFERNSETDLLEVLRKNSFLFYDLVGRKYGVQPIFHEVRLGAKLRCDFAWVNDHSYGPEWVLVEVEKPEMELFTRKGEPTYQLNHAIEQVRSWDRYFEDNPGSKKEIFGAVHSFRFVIVGGRRQDWQKESPLKWRSHFNKRNNIEIKSVDVFLDAVDTVRDDPNEFWSFEEHPVSLKESKLTEYWQNYSYFDLMRQVL